VTPHAALGRWVATSVLVVGLVPAAHAQQKVSAAYAATPDVSVRLFAAVGTLNVVGWDRDSVVVGGVVASGSKASLGAPSPVATRGLKLFVDAPTEQAGREGSLTLRVPRGARVWLKTGSADVTVRDVTGGLDVNVVGGSIVVHGSPRELRAESMDGAVTIDGAPAWMRVKTATGDISIRGGEDIGASTISGTIDARNGETERARLESTTGAIRFALDLERAASVEIETHSGQIDVRLARSSALGIDAATVTGTIESRGMRLEPSKGPEGRGMTLATSGGKMGGRLEIRSFKGRIAISPRE
jgi:hypothetical protein